MANRPEKPTGIASVIQLLSAGGGPALSNTYKVSFEVPERTKSLNKLIDKVKVGLPGFNQSSLIGDKIDTNSAAYISMMCDEATLPGVQAATGQVNGIYTGSGQYQYPHTRIYSDLTLSWICDANMTPLKFLQLWMELIFNEYDTSNNLYQPAVKKGNTEPNKRQRARSTRLSYPDEYTMQLSILKAERGSESETGRPSIRYVMEGVFPYAIDTIPLSFGTSQLLKVTANFYYERWYNVYIDSWNADPERKSYT